MKSCIERQREGIAKAKAEGKFKGRKPLDQGIVEEVLRLCETRITRKEVAERLEIGEATVYRVLKSAKSKNSNMLISSQL